MAQQKTPRRMPSRRVTAWGPALVSPVALVLAALACAPTSGPADAGPGPPVLFPATLDEAHVVGVVELGAGTSCAAYVWCGSNEVYERIDVAQLDAWVGDLGRVTRLLVPHATMEMVDRFFGARASAVLAGRVEGADDPALYASTCGMEPFEAFTWPVDPDALWVVDQDGATLWHLQCVLAVAPTITGGTDPQGRSFRDALRARPGCQGLKSRAFQDAQESAARVSGRATMVTGENRCRRRDIMDAGP